MNKFFFLLLLTYLWSCAKPCPADIKVGDLKFSNSTNEFLKVFKDLDIMEFENEKQQTLVLREKISHRLDKSTLPIEVLCERGDFFDKTSQIKYFQTQFFIRSYSTLNDDFEINVNVSINNDNSLMGLDTLIYESFSIWSQMISISGNGGFDLFPADRGGNDKLGDIVKSVHENHIYVADTTIAGHHFKNVYMNNFDKDAEIIVIYSKSKGIKCIMTPTDIWMRKS